MNDCSEYWKLAHAAIEEGILTHEDALTIARVGTRKQNFWARHVVSLTKILEERRG